MKAIPKEIQVRTIALNDYSLNLIHGLLVDEQIRLKEKIPILLAETNYEFDNVKAYAEEVKKLRKFFYRYR